MSEEYKDRFSDADKEQQEKSAFICESCKTKYSKNEAKQKGQSCCGRSMKELVEEGFGP
jgi:transcription initiation factor IIE alpha subunit